jgi:uncharacterized membrane protein required for colicin V production
MTWIDVVGILVIAGYGAGGFFTGVIRRLIGFIALYVALLAATHMGLQAGGILQQTSNFEVSDGRIYGFFGLMVALLVIVEGATQLAHTQIQIPALALNRTFGVIAGLITGFVLIVVCTYELGAAANPIGGTALDTLQLNIRGAYNGSHVIVPFVNKIDKPIIAIFQPALPGDPQLYFGPGPVSP